MDLVTHCGSSASGLFICSLNTVEISSGWWEAEAVMGKGQDPTFEALEFTRSRPNKKNDNAYIEQKNSRPL
jgi:hypothetical protein